MSKRQVEDITALIRQRAGLPKLPPAKARQPIPAGSGLSTQREVATPNSSSGIASPLTETARTVTAYNDGSHDYYVAVQSTCDDANGDEVVINWLQPGDPGITVV